MIRVLVFPAEGVNATEIHDALSSCVNIEVWGASSVTRHGPYVFENYRSGLPGVDDECFYGKFAEIVRELKIDVVIPTHDTVVYEFAKNEGLIPAKVFVPSLDTARACRKKSVTYELFQDCSFLPIVYKRVDEIINFPVFVKPDEGQGGKGARVVRSQEGLLGVDFANEVVTEFLPGEEFTVDCFTDRHGKLRCILPRRRARIENGISARAETLPATSEFVEIAQKINERTKFCGMWFLQLRRDLNGKLKLMEISARCAGTMCASRAKGYNLPLLTVYSMMGIDLDVIDNGYEVVADRELASTYSVSVPVERVFLDYDDTLVAGDLVNLNAIKLVYQCRNKGIPVFLITRHEGDLDEDMARHAIDARLFERVIHLMGNEPKAPYVNSSAGTIFVDNAFSERKAVHEASDMPVFDVSEIPVLLDRKFLGQSVQEVGA